MGLGIQLMLSLHSLILMMPLNRHLLLVRLLWILLRELAAFKCAARHLVLQLFSCLHLLVIIALEVMAVLGLGLDVRTIFRVGYILRLTLEA